MSDVNEYIIKASQCEEGEDYSGMFEAIRQGLAVDPMNYELYFMLGFYYLNSNINQAFLCFQNALHHCDNENDRDEINQIIEQLEGNIPSNVKMTNIIIVSYNGQYFMEKNIEAIRNTLPKGNYRICVVDNASTDGVRESLEEMEDVILIKNDENLGFSKACNQGVAFLDEIGAGNDDIFLLNNDTRLSENALFYLKLALYESDKNGAMGAVSNYAGNRQQIGVEFKLPNDYLEFGKLNNVLSDRLYEERVRLSGFATLIKGGLWQQVGGMDEEFSPGYFEDDDLCMKLSISGYRMGVCWNSFIYHAGSQSFSKREDVEDILIDHHQLFIKKYGFDILANCYADNNVEVKVPYYDNDEFNVLIVGVGLGAQIKSFRYAFPKSNIVGIEYEDKLRRIIEKTEAVFKNAKSLSEIINGPVFNVVVINKSVVGRISKEELDVLNSLCVREFKVIYSNEDKLIGDSDIQNVGDREYISDLAGKSKGLEKADEIDFKKIKLVIWDLDETFWKGTLSEGEVELIPENLGAVKLLTDAGIINSISSKNDEWMVNEKLDALGLSNLFVFNDINWNNKGEQIKDKLVSMNLRAENVLFIDDNQRNLEEAKHYSPELMCAGPDIFHKLYAYIEGLLFIDEDHKRLKQYQNLEAKRSAQKLYDDENRFLNDSGIEVGVFDNCTHEIDRIVELVERTNQLNYTKNREFKEKLIDLINDEGVRKGFVRVRDKYGDYGIAGFYCFEKNENKLRHFVFSCRIMGMGIPQYIYESLAKPDIIIAEPVAEKLDKYDTFSWIKMADENAFNAFEKNDEVARYGNNNSQGSDRRNKIRILLKGPCDMSALERYLIGGDIDTEFNFVNSEGFITTGQNHTMHIWQYANLSDDELQAIVDDVPFITCEDFETSIFDKEYDVICLSMLPDAHAGLYRNRNTDAYISFGSVNFDLTDVNNIEGYIDGTIVNHFYPFTKECIDKFSNDWEFVGTTEISDLLRNLDFICDNVKGNPYIVLVLGSEIDYDGENAEFANHAERHKKINEVVKAFAEDRDNIRIINATDYIRSQDDFEDCINHFRREVYYEMASDMVGIINEKVEEIKRGRNEHTSV